MTRNDKTDIHYTYVRVCSGHHESLTKDCWQCVSQMLLAKIDKVKAELRAARKRESALRKAITRCSWRCEDVHHNPSERHDSSQQCPVFDQVERLIMEAADCD